MSLASMLNQVCTITVPTASGVTDRAGVPAEVDVTLLGLGYFEQKQATDQTGIQSSDEQRWLAMVLPTASTDDTDPEDVELERLLNARSTVTPDGLGAFQVVGDPWPVRNPRTRAVEHIEFEMRRVVG